MRSAAARLLAALVVVSALACVGEPEGAAVPVPEYSAVTLDGDSASLADLRGDPVLLNVWATWCPPCRKEIPDLQALHEEFGEAGLQVVGVSIDAGDAARVREFLDQYDVTYAAWHDPGDRVSGVFSVRGVPSTYLLGSDGRILWQRLGPVHADDPALRDAIRTALGDG